MPYVCRSCLLRLGQPWHIASSTPRLRLVPPSSTRLSQVPYWQRNHGVAFSTGGGGARVAHAQTQQDDGGVHASMTDDVAMGYGLDSAQPRPDHRPHGFDRDPARQIDTEPQQSRGYNYEKIAVPGPAEMVEKFTASDQRVKFVKKVQKVKDDSWHMATILRRFGETELFQQERLAQISKGKGRHLFLHFQAWKDIVKQFPGQPANDYTQLPPTTQAQIHWLQECANAEEMAASIARFRGMYGSLRRQRDLQLVMMAIQYVPDKLLPLFTAIIRDWDTPSMLDFYVFEDVVGILALRLEDMKDAERTVYAEEVAALVLQIVEHTRRHYVQIPQAAMFRLIKALPSASVADWYQALCAADCNIHMFTHLQFAARMAKLATSKELSAQVLHNLKAAGMLTINSPVAASVCTSILTFKKDDIAALDGIVATPADLFSSLHQIGLIPNVITYSAIIRGLCLKGDLSTAFDVFGVMKTHGVEPDAFTYSILLHGCKLAGDFNAFTDIALQACFANVRDPVVWNDVLHAVYLACLRERKDRRGPRRTALFALNSIYTRIFDPEPIRPFVTKRLIEMGDFSTLQRWFPDALKRLALEIPPLGPLEVVQPGSDTVAIMLLGLVRYLPLPYDVVLFYTQFRQMLAEGHPVAERMVRERGSFVHDVVLRNLFKWKGTMRIALDIIGDMMRDVGHPSTQKDKAHHRNKKVDGTEHDTEAQGEGNPQLSTPAATEAHNNDPTSRGPSQLEHNEHEHEHFQESPSIRHPAPSVYTWSILIQGFMRHNQPRQAERVLSLMQEHGVKPNIVTWNTLAAGYARLQKVSAAVDAMRRLEAAGFKADDATLRAFSYISDKAKAVRLMEETVETNKQRKLEEELRLHRQTQQLPEEEWVDVDEEEVVDVDGFDGNVGAAGAYVDGAQRGVGRQQHDHQEPSEENHDDEDEDVMEKEEEALDDEMTRHLYRLDPGTVPRKKSSKILRVVKELERIAPVTQRPEFEHWARIRREGLAATETLK